MDPKPSEIKPTWLKKRVAASRLDEEILANIQREFPAKTQLSDVVGIYVEKQTKILLSQKEAGDELWHFDNKKLEGFALVRNGKAVAFITTWQTIQKPL